MALSLATATVRPKGSKEAWATQDAIMPPFTYKSTTGPQHILRAGQPREPMPKKMLAGMQAVKVVFCSGSGLVKQDLLCLEAQCQAAAGVTTCWIWQG